MTDLGTSPASGPLPKRDYTWPIVGGLFLAFWIVYLIVASPGEPEPIELSVLGRPADYNWTLHDLDGRPVKFMDFAGKAVFLNIWATWCPPCIVEMPSIARLAADPGLQGKNIVFVCVATDDEIDAVRRYVRDKKWPMTILHANAMPGVFLIEGLPSTFIIAPDGRVVSTTVGGQEWDTPETVKSLQAVAAVPPGTPAASPTATARPAA